jgi:hypothetical protein
LTKLVGETVLVIVAKGASELDNLPADALQFALQTMVERLGEDTVEHTIKELLSTMRVAGTEQTVDQIFDAHFQGRIMHLFRVVQYAMEANYRDFFDALRSRNIGKAGPGAASSAA